MRAIKVDNYIITTPLIDVLNQLRLSLTNGKLREIQEAGDNIVVTCPHHSGGHEHKAACNVYRGNNDNIEYGYFRCFVCEEQGSFVKFVAECFDSSEEFAKKWLIKNFGILNGNVVSFGEEIDFMKPWLAKTKNYVPLDASVLDTYQHWHPYLEKRKLSRDVCELFNIRYDPKYRQIVFPCYSIYGDLVMMPRRSIDFKQFYIDKDVEKPVYCLDYLIKNDYRQAIICEGLIDCLYAYSCGFPACALMGQPSPEQINAINKSPLQVLYMCMDNDKAGRRFAETLQNRLSKRILLIDVQLPAGKKDINELTPTELKSLLEKYRT